MFRMDTVLTFVSRIALKDPQKAQNWTLTNFSAKPWYWCSIHCVNALNVYCTDFKEWNINSVFEYRGLTISTFLIICSLGQKVNMLKFRSIKLWAKRTLWPILQYQLSSYVNHRMKIQALCVAMPCS